MGFSINSKRDAPYRNILTAADRQYMQHCKHCPVQNLCGGWSVWDDSRWCVGPGDVCMGGEHPDYPHGCRAICSRSPEKVEVLTRWLGEGNFRENPAYSGDPENREHNWDIEVYPDLDILGKHPWEPWSFDWPDVGFQLNAHADKQDRALYTVSLKHLYYPERGSWSPQKDLRKRFAIPKESGLAITTTTHDDILDTLAQDLPSFAEELSEYEGVDFIFAPNFSVYDNYPRLDALFQIKRKWIMLELLQKQGVKVLPDICFVTSTDFKAQLQWMRDNHCTMMLMNFQVQAVTTNTPQWRAQIKAAMMIQERLDWPVQLIAYGATGGDRMLDVARLYGQNVTFIDAKAYRLAEFHKTLDLNVNKTIPVKDLFQLNCEESIRRVRAAKGEANAACA